jgi:mannosyltransferase OCH1-like enzyme
MAIPQTIYQTYKTDRLPFLTQWHINRLQKRNPGYDYQFYNDERITEFIRSEYGTETFNLYSRIQIGAAKADFFRYAVLFNKGGVYLDIDSLCMNRLDDFISPSDSAIISLETHKKFYVQWALVFEAGHPFLEKTLEILLDNLKSNRYPHDIHSMTGPAAFTTAINECLIGSTPIQYKELGPDYDGNFKFHYRFSKFFLYGVQRKNYWRKQQEAKPILLDY